MNWIKWLRKWLSPTYRYRKRVEELQKELEEKNQKISELQTELDRWIHGAKDVTIHSTDFSTVRKDVANELEIPENNVQVLDREMEYVSIEDAQKIVEEDLTDTVKYVKDSDEFVCNHFAGLFAALVKLKYKVDVAMLIDYDAHHAYNLWYFPDADNDKKVQIMEPQTDEFEPTGKHYTPATKSVVEWGI